MKVTQVVPMFSVSNIEESIRYYIDGLGFQMTSKWVDKGKLRWCCLQHGGAALMLQEFDSMPEGMPGQGVSIWFQCEDSLALYREVSSKGIQARNPFVGNASWDTMLTDRDGYVLHFTSPTDVPEGTEYSGQGA